MTHSLDNGEVYFPIEGGLAGGRDTYPRRELTRSKAFPWVPSGKNLFDRKETVPFQCKHVQLLAYAFSRPFRPYRETVGGRNRPILGINIDRFLLLLSFLFAFSFFLFPRQTRRSPYVNIKRIFLFSFFFFFRLSREIIDYLFVIKRKEWFFSSPWWIFIRVKWEVRKIQAISIWFILIEAFVICLERNWGDCYCLIYDVLHACDRAFVSTSF